MKTKTKFYLWVLLDLLLLVGVIFVCAFFFSTMTDLKSPCYKCAKDRPEISPCLAEPIYKNEFEFNISEIIKENNK